MRREQVARTSRPARHQSQGPRLYRGPWLFGGSVRRAHRVGPRVEPPIYTDAKHAVAQVELAGNHGRIPDGDLQIEIIMGHEAGVQPLSLEGRVAPGTADFRAVTEEQRSRQKAWPGLRCASGRPRSAPSAQRVVCSGFGLARRRNIHFNAEILGHSAPASLRKTCSWSGVVFVTGRTNRWPGRRCADQGNARLIISGVRRLAANCRNHWAIVEGFVWPFINARENRPSATCTPSWWYASNCSSSKN